MANVWYNCNGNKLLVQGIISLPAGRKGPIMEFIKGAWNEGINVRDFIVNNYTPYDGDESFLAAPTERTRQLWDELCVLLEAERKAPGRVLDADTKVISSITAHEAGYINKDLEVIVSLQT